MKHVTTEKRATRWAMLAAAGALAIGCGGTESATPTVDAAAVDTGPVDTGPVDTGPVDTGPVDTGPVDTGPVDTGPVDTGPVDTGPVDTGPVDTGPVDTGPVDAGVADAGCTELAPCDAAVVDAGGPTRTALRPGRFSTLGVRGWATGSVRIVDDELESGDRQCTGTGATRVCVTGGFLQ